MSLPLISRRERDIEGQRVNQAPPSQRRRSTLPLAIGTLLLASVAAYWYFTRCDSDEVLARVGPICMCQFQDGSKLLIKCSSRFLPFMH